MKISISLLPALVLSFALSGVCRADVASDVCASTVQSVKEVLGAQSILGSPVPADYFNFTKQNCSFRVQDNIDGTKSAFIDFDFQAERFEAEKRTYHWTTYGSERGTSDMVDYKVFTGQIECTTNPNFAWICLYKSMTRNERCSADHGNWKSFGREGWRISEFRTASPNSPCGDGYIRGEKWQTGKWLPFQGAVAATYKGVIQPTDQTQVLDLISDRVDDLVLPFLQ